MQGWMPVPGSVKGALALLALAEFGANRYDDVSVVDLAARAGVTTGSLYHHFGSKRGLYDVVRDEIEQRLLDRMEAAIETTADEGRAEATRAALGVAFDAALKFSAARMLSEPHPDRADDPLEAVLASTVPRHGRTLARLLLAALRAAWDATLTGAKPAKARAALLSLVS